MTLEEAIKHCEKKAEECERDSHFDTDYVCYQMSEAERKELRECASEHRQLAEWLRELQRYEFEISECKAILDNPTPDVTENDKKRAMFVLQTFPDVRGDEI